MNRLCLGRPSRWRKPQRLKVAGAPPPPAARGALRRWGQGWLWKLQVTPQRLMGQDGTGDDWRCQLDGIGTGFLSEAGPWRESHPSRPRTSWGVTLVAMRHASSCRKLTSQARCLHPRPVARAAPVQRLFELHKGTKCAEMAPLPGPRSLDRMENQARSKFGTQERPACQRYMTVYVCNLYCIYICTCLHVDQFSIGIGRKLLGW